MADPQGKMARIPRTADQRDNVAQTYLALRLGIVVIVGLLFFSLWLVIRTVAEGEILESISAYYYTPAQVAFIGTLFAIGVSLIAYRGTSEAENFLLDFAGFIAFLIAVIPTPNHPNLNTDNDPSFQGCGYCVIPDDTFVTTTVVKMSWALLVVGVVATIVGIWVGKRTADGARQPLDWAAWTAIGISSACLSAFGVWLWKAPEEIVDMAHNVAAPVFFGAIIITVIVNAVDFAFKKQKGTSLVRRIFANPYAWVAFAMMVALGLVLFAELSEIDWSVFWLEVVLIVSFGVYWAVQTIELQGKVVRPSKPAETAMLRSTKKKA